MLPVDDIKCEQDFEDRMLVIDGDPYKGGTTDCITMRVIRKPYDEETSMFDLCWRGQGEYEVHTKFPSRLYDKLSGMASDLIEGKEINPIKLFVKFFGVPVHLNRCIMTSSPLFPLSGIDQMFRFYFEEMRPAA